MLDLDQLENLANLLAEPLLATDAKIESVSKTFCHGCNVEGEGADQGRARGTFNTQAQI